MSSNERTPLLWSHTGIQNANSNTIDYHEQFCALVGVPSTTTVKDKRPISKTSLYARATGQLRSQRRVYNLSAAINNGLLLTQVVLGAALTALGAAKSDHVLIAVFGAMNTIIAGIVAYLKSRGQPMRARMYRDDLERVVDEIENSEIMWRGITGEVHGYSDIDTDDVTVRSEVARLTRLYDRAVRNNTSNNPDMYMAGGTYDGAGGAFRPRVLPSQPVAALPATVPVTTAATGSGASAVPVAPAAPAPDPDASPATSAAKKEPAAKPADTPVKDESTDKGKAPENTSPTPDPDPAPTPAPAPAPAPAPVQAQAPNILDQDPDASPATAVLKRKTTSTSTKSSKEEKKEKEQEDKPKKVEGEDDD